MAALVGRRYMLEALRREVGIALPYSTMLMGEFTAVCKRGCLNEINAFYAERIMKEPVFGFEAYKNYPTNIPGYSRFMGSVYCNLKDLSGPVSIWFLQKATEIHRLY